MLSELEIKQMQIDNLKNVLSIVIHQILNFDDIFELKVLARCHAMDMGIIIEEPK